MFASCSSEVRRHSRVFAAKVQRETVLGSRLSACHGSGGQPGDAGQRQPEVYSAAGVPQLAELRRCQISYFKWRSREIAENRSVVLASKAKVLRLLPVERPT